MDGAILHPDPVRTVQIRHGSRSSSLALVDVVADQRDGRSHSAAIDKPTRSARSRPPPPARGPPTPAPRCAGPPRWWCRAGRRRPTRTPWRIPAAQGLGVDPQLVAHAPQTPPRPVRVGQGVQRQPDRTSSELIGVLPGCGHDPHPSMDSDPPPHPGRSSTEAEGTGPACSPGRLRFARRWPTSTRRRSRGKTRSGRACWIRRSSPTASATRGFSATGGSTAWGSRSSTCG